MREEQYSKVATIGERIQQLLDEKGVSQADVVRATGIDKTKLSHWIKGDFKPRSNGIAALSTYFGVSEPWLMGYDVEKSRTVAQIKNDQIADLVIRLRTDEAFFKLVEELNSLDSKTFDTVAGVVRLTAALGQNSENKI